MAFEFKNILNLHEKYIDYLLSKSHFSHQGVRNITLCGSEVEQEIRAFLACLLPKRFKVTHGYILYAKDNISEPVISGQIDLIIVDTLVTHSIFTLDKENGMEIVPVESVVGLLEIKRTLNKASFDASIKHLKEIINTAGITKTNSTHYLPGGIPLDGITSGIHSNPLIGIISLDHDCAYFERKGDTCRECIEPARRLKLDLIASLSGLLICPTDTESKTQINSSTKSSNVLIKNVHDDDTSQINYGYCHHESTARTAIISRLIGYIIAYLSNVSGRKLDVRNYFFNETTWQLLAQTNSPPVA